jgi:hypothetical protein
MESGGREWSKQARIKTTVLVIGTRHEYQRHQDTMPDREKIRAKFRELVRRVIEEREKTDLANCAARFAARRLSMAIVSGVRFSPRASAPAGLSLASDVLEVPFAVCIVRGGRAAS